MTQQAPVQLTYREEERVLGISYDRAVPAVPRLVKAAIGADVQELGDGYWIATLEREGGIKREVTIRLGKQGADTRFSVRAETTSQGTAFIAAVIIIAVLTAGLGILFFIGAIQRRQRAEQRERDLLVHKTFRAIEDAVAEQGAAPNYRVAPGAGANERETSAEPGELSGDDADEPRGARRP